MVVWMHARTHTHTCIPPAAAEVNGDEGEPHLEHILQALDGVRAAAAVAVQVDHRGHQRLVAVLGLQRRAAQGTS